MRRQWDIYCALGLIAAGGAVALFHAPGGSAGTALVFFGMIIAPGYAVARALFDEALDPWEAYPLSMVLGVFYFGIAGTAMFLIGAPIAAAYPIMAGIGIVTAVALIAGDGSSGWERIDKSGLGWTFTVIMILTVAVAFLLGGFRGWYGQWDYYTFITAVRRLATRGYAGNFPLYYPDEGIDPSHTYNIWALMWAAISGAAGIDPVALYVKSAVLTVPAAALAFYSLVKKLFDRRAAMAAAICYVLYHALALGFIEFGRSAFYNADAAWLIFFPVALRHGWDYIERGGRRRFASCLAAAAGATMLHPLWGFMAAAGVALAALSRVLSAGRPESALSRVGLWSGWAVLLAPVVWAAWKVFTGYRAVGAGTAISWQGLLIFVGVPVLFWIPRLAEAARKSADLSRKAVFLFAGVAISIAPFALLHFLRSAAMGTADFDPYKWFLSNTLFVLDPFQYTYTEPDLTLFPWILIGAAALPWLAIRAARGDKSSHYIVAGAVAMPLVAASPYLTPMFSAVFHADYLRQALRFSSMFAAAAAGVWLWTVSQKAGRWAWIALVIAGVAAASASALYPFRDSNFRRAVEKSLFIIEHPPSKGLFWHPLMDADNYKNAKWDTGEFSRLLEHIPLEETVVTDAFTGYRLTAYRDVYVILSPGPASAEADRERRKADYGKFMTAIGDAESICKTLRRYRSRWILFNADPGYTLKGKALWSPLVIKTILDDKGRFELVDTIDYWGLVRAGEDCSPWPPE